MKANFRACLDFVLRWEGGFVNHPRDPGGATNRGITLATYRRHRPGATVDELRRISDAEVERIYYLDYWRPVRGDELPSGVDLCGFDGAVNSGPARSIKWLQQAVGVPADGIMGPVTLKAVLGAVPAGAIRRYCAIRLSWLQGLRHWRTFGRGWARRVGALEARALAMAGMAPGAVMADAKETSAKTRAQAAQGGAGGAVAATGGGAVTDHWQIAAIAAAIIVVAVVLVVWRRLEWFKGVEMEMERMRGDPAV